jgi:hypothetical protein
MVGKHLTVPAGYVASAMLDRPKCGTGVNQAGFNAYQLESAGS